MADYTAAFNDIVIRLPDLSDSAKLCLFIAGLKLSVKKDVVAKEPLTLSAATILAETYDDPHINRTSDTITTPQPDYMDLGIMARKKGSCRYCGVNGHRVADCRKRIDNERKRTYQGLARRNDQDRRRSFNNLSIEDNRTVKEEEEERVYDQQGKENAV